MNVLLIVDDDLKDLRYANDIALSVGFSDIEGRTSAEQARIYLNAALEGKCHLPDAMVIDLQLGKESGYELIRHCLSHPRLASIPTVVWSILGESQRELCGLFKVRSVVAKKGREGRLREALRELQEIGA